MNGLNMHRFSHKTFSTTTQMSRKYNYSQNFILSNLIDLNTRGRLNFSGSIHLELNEAWHSYETLQTVNNKSAKETKRMPRLVWAVYLSLGVCEQQRRRPACASVQTGQRLCYTLTEKYHIYTCYERNFNFLASLCS